MNFNLRVNGHCHRGGVALALAIAAAVAVAVAQGEGPVRLTSSVLALIGRWIAKENPGKAPTGIGSHATATEKEI